MEVMSMDVVKELEFDKEVLKRIEMICRFACVKPIIKQGSIINIKGTNIAYVSPHIITVGENNYLIFNGSDTLFINDYSKSELYRHRIVLFCALCNLLPEISWKSKKHFDEENDPMFNDSFIAGINTPEGVATYHIKLKYWEMFNIPELERAPKYEQYDSDDVIERVYSLSKIKIKNR